MDDLTPERLADLTARSKRQRRRFHAQQPRPVGKLMGQLVLSRRYAASQTHDHLAEVWTKIVGPAMAARSEAIGVKRGEFEVMVANSTLMQELSFDRARIVTALQQALPETKIQGVRFRIGKRTKQ